MDGEPPINQAEILKLTEKSTSINDINFSGKTFHFHSDLATYLLEVITRTRL